MIYDNKTNTYSMKVVTVKYPCRVCNSQRPMIPGSLVPGVCCKTSTLIRGRPSAIDKEE